MRPATKEYSVRSAKRRNSHLAANPFLRVDINNGVGASKIISCPDT